MKIRYSLIDYLLPLFCASLLERWLNLWLWLYGMHLAGMHCLSCLTCLSDFKKVDTVIIFFLVILFYFKYFISHHIKIASEELDEV